MNVLEKVGIKETNDLCAKYNIYLYYISCLYILAYIYYLEKFNDCYKRPSVSRKLYATQGL